MAVKCLKHQRPPNKTLSDDGASEEASWQTQLRQLVLEGGAAVKEVIVRCQTRDLLSGNDSRVLLLKHCMDFVALVAGCMGEGDLPSLREELVGALHDAMDDEDVQIKVSLGGHGFMW